MWTLYPFIGSLICYSSPSKKAFRPSTVPRTGRNLFVGIAGGVTHDRVAEHANRTSSARPVAVCTTRVNHWVVSLLPIVIRAIALLDE